MPAMEAARHRNFRALAAITAVAVVIAFGASIVERNERLFTTSSPFTASLERDLRPTLWAVAWTQFKAAPDDSFRASKAVISMWWDCRSRGFMPCFAN